MTSPREILVAKLAQARAILAHLGRQRGSKSTIAWQKGYVAALEESLDVEGLSLRQHPRRATAVPTEIARTRKEKGVPGQRGQGTIMDLSIGGCRLYTAAMELWEDEVLELTFMLPGSRTAITLRGCVRRVIRVEGALGAGVEFMNLPESVAAELQAFLSLPLPPEERTPSRS